MTEVLDKDQFEHEWRARQLHRIVQTPTEPVGYHTIILRTFLEALLGFDTIIEAVDVPHVQQPTPKSRPALPANVKGRRRIRR